VVYDGSDSSIIDIESLREPELEEEPINSYFISTLTRMLSCALDRISNNDLESQADAGSWHAEYDATVAEIPMDLGQNNNSFAEFQIGSGHLKGLLIMSFQLTTSAWQFADLDSLPSELKTTAFPATLVHRAFIKARSLLLFVGAESAMIVWAVLILVSPNILLFGAGTYPKAPNSPEGLSAGKSMIQKIDATKPGLVKIFMRSITELCMHRSWRWNGRIGTTKICVDNGRPRAGPTESLLLEVVDQPEGPRYQEEDAGGIADHLSGTRVLKYDRIFDLTPWDLVPSLTLIDRIKQIIQQQVNFPIIWWPLKPGNRSCKKGHVRISWKCVSTIFALSSTLSHFSAFGI
jgi:hypothetical protein